MASDLTNAELNNTVGGNPLLIDPLLIGIASGLTVATYNFILNNWADIKEGIADGWNFGQRTEPKLIRGDHCTE